MEYYHLQELHALHFCSSIFVGGIFVTAVISMSMSIFLRDLRKLPLCLFVRYYDGGDRSNHGAPPRRPHLPADLPTD